MNIHRLTDRITMYEFDDLKILMQASHFISVIELEDAIYFIDSGLGPEQVEPILARYQKPAHLILTHSHWDHIWGAQAITGDIYAQRAFPEMVSERMLKKFRRYNRGATRLVTPNILIDDHYQLGELELFATPGHTRCGMSIWDPVDQALFVGDSLFVIERDHSLTQEHLASLKLYREYPFKYLIPGHVGVLGSKELERSIAILEAALANPIESE